MVHKSINQSQCSVPKTCVSLNKMIKQIVDWILEIGIEKTPIHVCVYILYFIGAFTLILDLFFLHFYFWMRLWSEMTMAGSFPPWRTARLCLHPTHWPFLNVCYLQAEEKPHLTLHSIESKDTHPPITIPHFPTNVTVTSAWSFLHIDEWAPSY